MKSYPLFFEYSVKKIAKNLKKDLNMCIIDI